VPDSSKDMRPKDRINRRGFIKGASVFSLMLMLNGDSLSLNQKRSIEFYGLFHFESPEVNTQTIARINETLDKHHKVTPYDLISVELPYDLEGTNRFISAHERLIESIECLDEENEDMPPNGLRNTIAYLRMQLGGVRHSRAAILWADKNHVPYVSIDTRVDEYETHDGEKVSTKNPEEIFDVATENLFKLDVEELIDLEICHTEELEKHRRGYKVYFEFLQRAYEIGTPIQEMQDWYIRKYKAEEGLRADQDMADNLLAAMKKFHARNIAHFGGALHFASSTKHNTLYDIMAEKATCTRRLLLAAPDIMFPNNLGLAPERSNQHTPFPTKPIYLALPQLPYRNVA